MKHKKRLLKNIESLMRFDYWWRYRIIITNHNIELKLTPKYNKDREMNWIIANETDTILSLCMQLERMISNNGLPL